MYMFVFVYPPLNSGVDPPVPYRHSHLCESLSGTANCVEIPWGRCAVCTRARALVLAAMTPSRHLPAIRTRAAYTAVRLPGSYRLGRDQDLIQQTSAAGADRAIGHDVERHWHGKGKPGNMLPMMSMFTLVLRKVIAVWMSVPSSPEMSASIDAFMASIRSLVRPSVGPGWAAPMIILASWKAGCNSCNVVSGVFATKSFGGMHLTRVYNAS